jgi:membrane protease YdiL (CAAX protease family)
MEALQAVFADPLMLGLSALLQTGGLLGIAFGLMFVLKRPFGRGLAIRRSRMAPLGAAVVVGLTAGFFAGWIAELLSRVEAFDSAIFDMIGDALLDGPLAPRLIFLAVVVVFAPLVEELIFRGFLWDSLEESWGSTGAWLATSVLFAGYHLVPLHVISIFSTGLLIGWLRKVSGSVWPCVLAHFVNNALSSVFVFASGSEEEYVVGFGQAMAGLAACLVAGVVAWRWGRPSTRPARLVRSEAPLESD